MEQNEDRKARRRLLALGLTTVASAWAVYKATNTRVEGTPMAADTGCQTEPRTVAGMSRFTPGAAPIRCQPWDIGTGVTGYVWHAPVPGLCCSSSTATANTRSGTSGTTTGSSLTC